MDNRLTAYIIITLLLGGGLGFIGGSIINRSSPNRLQEENKALTEQVNDLTTSLQSSVTENTALQETIETLRNKTIANKTIKIGYVATKQVSVNAEQYIKQIIESDLNEYASKLSYPIRFEIVVDTSPTTIEKYLDVVKSFKTSGINLYVGGNRNAGPDVSLSYAISHKMLMISVTSNQTDFAEGDRPGVPLFRLCPVAAYAGTSLVDLMWSYGIREAAILYPGDSPGDGISYDFASEWEKRGGVILGEPVRYDPSTVDYTGYLRSVDAQVKQALEQSGAIGARVGVLVVGRGNAEEIVIQAQDYPSLYNVTWFGGKDTANNTVLASEAGVQAAHLKWISVKEEVSSSISFVDLSNRYRVLTGDEIDIYSAYLYDAFFILARSVVEVQSVEAADVRGVFPIVCASTFGVSGWCGLDGNGDRIPSSYEIWSYEVDGEGSVICVNVGKLDSYRHIVTFYQPVK